MAESYDAIVIGAGHNGLVCAAYLARTGLRTLMVAVPQGPGLGITLNDDVVERYQVA